jgi:hypothetical protein
MKQHNLKLFKGRTTKLTALWESDNFTYKAITGIQRTAPVRITCAGHGLHTGWYAAVSDVVGMTQINSKANSPDESDYHRVTVIDANTIEFNDMSAASFSAYKSGGYLRYREPVSLVGCRARMDIKDRVGGTLMLALDDTSGIEIDDVNNTINITIPHTATFSKSRAKYDLEVINASGEVITLLYESDVIINDEVTTSE